MRGSRLLVLAALLTLSTSAHAQESVESQGPSTQSHWGYGLLGAGGVGLLSGLTFTLAANASSSSHAGEMTFDDDVGTYRNLARASAIGGVMLGVAGLTLVLTDSPSPEGDGLYVSWRGPDLVVGSSF